MATKPIQLPTQLIKNDSMKLPQISMLMNIDLAFMLQTVSEMKHTLEPYFLLPYFLILRAKIIICPDNDPEVCCCCGCLLARRMSSLLSQSPGLAERLAKEASFDPILKRIFSDKSKIFELGIERNLKAKPQDKVEPCEKELTLLSKLIENKYQEWEGNEEMVRFLSIFYLAANVKKIVETNIQDLILTLLEVIKKRKVNEEQRKLLYQIQILFSK